MNNSQILKIQNVILWMLFVILPLTYMLPLANYILLIAIIILSLFLAANRFLRDKLFVLKTGKNYTGIVNLLFYALIIWFLIVTVVEKTEPECAVRIIQILGCFIAFNLGANQYWSTKTISNVQYAICVIFFIALAFWAIKGFPLSNYSFFFSNANTFSSLLLVWILFLLIGDHRKKYIIVISGIGNLLLYVSTARAAILSFGVYFIIYYLLMHDSKKYRIFGKKIIFKWELIFTMFLAFMVAFIFIYPNLVSTDIGKKLQLLSVQYTRKNFFSGRQVLWQKLVSLIKSKPITGYGLGALPVDFMNMDKSAHNIFLQIALQSGLIGLGLLVLILKRIYTNCLSHSNSDFALRAISILFAVVIHENFEVTLTQNLLVAGLQIWFVFGMGCIERRVVDEQSIYSNNA